jgi:hypothetical protein
MLKQRVVVPMLLIMLTGLAGCLIASEQASVIRAFPLDGLEGVISGSEVTFDKGVSSDGKGSLKIVADKPTVVKLFTTGDMDIENATLIYQAKLRTENVKGKAYLEMWCRFPGKGSFFSRGLADPLSGTNDWTVRKTPFFLKVGENPDNVKLNVAIDGTGTVWIDDIKLLKARLK